MKVVTVPGLRPHETGPARKRVRPMSLQQMYETASRVDRKKCKVCDWRRGLDAEDRAFFDEKLTGNIYQLARAAKASGFSVNESTLRKHRDNCVVDQ